ncbi:MAG: RNA polymerase sigma factor RpoH [Pseudomonadota bacterium]
MSKSLQLVDFSPTVGSLGAYTHWINQVPVLSAEEEHDLALRLRNHGDLQAARQLVMAHLRFVAKIAKGYAGYGLAQADLIQEGNIGLMKAVRRFNPNVGVRLVSFAVHWIKAEIHEYILKNWRIVKVATTKAQRKLFFNLRSMKKRLGWLNEQEVNDIAETLNVKPKDIYTMEQRLNANDMAFDMETDDSQQEQTTSFSPALYLHDEKSDPASLLEMDDTGSQSKTRLHEALKNIDARGQDIIRQRWLVEKKATLHDLAAKYNISAERVRQLEQQAMTKLKTALIN